MKKKLPLLVLSAVCVVSSAAALSACTAAHNFSEEWSSDDSFHYHDCTDESCNEQRDKAAHVWDNGTPVVPATCTDEGSTKYKCTVCDYEKTETVGALNHDWDDWTVAEADKPAVDATGKATRACKRDGCTVKHEKEIELPNLLSKDYVLSNVTATCTEAGTATYTYEKDGDTVVFSAAKAALGHNYSQQFTVTEDGHYRPCLNDGCDVKSVEGDHVWNVIAKDASDTSLTYQCAVCRDEKPREIEFSDLVNGSNAVTVTHDAPAYFKYIVQKSGLVRFKAEERSAKITVIADGELRSFGMGAGVDGYLSVEAGAQLYLVCDTNNSTSATYDLVFAESGAETNPIRLNADADGTTQTVSLKAGEKVYYMIMGGNAFYVSFTEVDATLTVVSDGKTYTGANGDNVVIDATGIGGVGEKGSEALDGEEGLLFYFTSEKEVTFDVGLKVKYDLGSYTNPFTAKLGDNDVSVIIETTTLNGRPSTEAQQLYYAFKPAESGWYRFSSDTENAALISMTYDRYGDNGNGFSFSVYIDKDKFASGYLVQLTTAGGDYALDYTFKVEKEADPVQLTLGAEATATEDGLFFAYQVTADADYIFTVSTLGNSEYWVVEYESQGLKQRDKVKTTSHKIFVKSGQEVLLRLNAPCTVKVEKDDRDPYALSLGKSTKITANKDYTFTVPADGDYTITLSGLTRGSFWKLNGTMSQNKTETLTGLKAGDKVTAYLIDTNKTVTILPVGAETLSLTADKTLALEAGATKLLHLVGTADATYLINLSVTGVTLTDYNDSAITGNGFTADENGNVLLLVTNTGSEDIAELTVTAQQVLNLGETALTAKVTYSFTATESGNYVISGVKLGKTPDTNGYFMVNGEKVIVNDTGATASDLTYTISNVQAGDVITIYSPLAQASFSLALAA